MRPLRHSREQDAPPGGREPSRLGFFPNLPIARRLGIAFAAVVGLTIALGIISILSLRGVTSTYDGLIAERAANRADALGLQTDVAREAAAFRGYLLTGKGDFLDAFSASTAAFDEGVDAIRARTPEDGRRLDEITSLHTGYLDAVEQARAAEERGDAAAAARIVAANVGPANQAAQDALDPFVEAQGAALRSGSAGARSSASTAQSLALGALIAAVLLAIGLAFAITRSIVGPLRRLAQATTTAAAGDLTVQVGATSRDELGAVSRAFDAMVGSLREVVGRVAEAARAQAQTAEEMAQASEQTGMAISQIAATIGEVARGASDQATATHSVTQTVEEMALGIAQVAQGGQSAAGVASDADRAAADGAETVDAATEAMRSIEEKVAVAAEVVTALGTKSAAIGDIVSTIGDIAAQTNLLALNAAIEAARAGEQGRGFAVVAEEVRKLAESTGQQAGSIAGLIGEIQAETQRAVEAMAAGREEVGAGAERVQAAGESFENIREMVVRLSGEVTQVAAAAQELEAGTQQVKEGVSATASVSEENAAAAQEVAASTEETSASSEQVSASAQQLAGAAEELNSLVSRFTI